MNVTLDKSALYAAMEAFWDAPTGNDKGVEAAIVAYLARMGLAGIHEKKRVGREAFNAVISMASSRRSA